MKKVVKKFLVYLFVLFLSLTPVLSNADYLSITTVEAHSGRTDSSGGHKDNKNKSGLGSYHYHCGGNPPHKHSDGKCPYSSNVSTTQKKTKKSEVSADLVKKVQKALNKLGYDCGKADGVQGSKTTKALKEFQEDNNLTVDGVISDKVKKALNIK